LVCQTLNIVQFPGRKHIFFCLNHINYIFEQCRLFSILPTGYLGMANLPISLNLNCTGKYNLAECLTASIFFVPIYWCPTANIHPLLLGND
jgi:hypothetical protein